MYIETVKMRIAELATQSVNFKRVDCSQISRLNCDETQTDKNKEVAS